MYNLAYIIMYANNTYERGDKRMKKLMATLKVAIMVSAVSIMTAITVFASGNPK